MSSHYFLQANSSSKSYHDCSGLMKEKQKPQLKYFTAKRQLPLSEKKVKEKENASLKFFPNL